MEVSECAGFKKNDDPEAAGDSFFPADEEKIAEMLTPLSVLLKKATYHHRHSRCAAELIAKYLMKPRKPKALLLRYFLRIQSYSDWVEKLVPLEYKFEPHLDGTGVRKFLKTKCPEKLIWEHFDYIRRHCDFMVSRESQKLFMAFDIHSKVETFEPFPEKEINDYV
jgi:hypothetical protein